MQDSAQNTQKVSGGMDQLAAVASRVQETGRDVARARQSLAEQIDGLKAEIDGFLNQARAA